MKAWCEFHEIKTYMCMWILYEHMHGFMWLTPTYLWVYVYSLYLFESKVLDRWHRPQRSGCHCTGTWLNEANFLLFTFYFVLCLKMWPCISYGNSTSEFSRTTCDLIENSFHYLTWPSYETGKDIKENCELFLVENG